MLTARTLSKIRQATLRAMTDTCQLGMPIRPSDGAGGWSETFPQSGEVPCRVQPAGATGPAVVAEREASVSRFKLTVPYTVTTLVIGLQVVHNGFKYEVRELMNDQTPFVFRQAIIERIDG